jgi:hypothetical protein
MIADVILPVLLLVAGLAALGMLTHVLAYAIDGHRPRVSTHRLRRGAVAGTAHDPDPRTRAAHIVQRDRAGDPAARERAARRTC